MPEIKSFKHYVSNADREYHYRIKTVVELNDERLDRIERLLMKHDLREIGRPKKTMMQRHPLDFQKLDAAEVWILDVITGLPVSAYILQQEIRTVLELPEDQIVVRTDNDPMEVEAERQNALHDIDAEAKKAGLSRSSLLNTSGYYKSENNDDAASFVGNEHNSQLLDYLARVAATRKPEQIKPDTPELFNFIDHKKPENADENDFNTHIEGAPKSVPWWERLEGDAFDAYAGIADPGNFDDDQKIYTGIFKDDKGNRKEVSATTGSIRAKKGKK
jgi:hypothetical protein